MADGHETGTSVQRRSEVVACSLLDVAGVNCHADPEGRLPRFPLKEPLSIDGGANGVWSPLEGCGQPVATRREDDSSGCPDDLAKYAVMARQGFGHRCTVVFP